MTAGRQITHAAADTTSPAGGGLRAGGRILAGETLGRGSGTEDDTRMAVIDRVSRSARARPGRAGWVIAAGSAAVLAVLFAWPATRYALTSADPTNIDPLVAFTLGFGVVGALILSRLGSNALGWLYAGAGGLAGAVTLALLAYARVGLAAHPGSLPGAVAVGWVSSWVGTFCFCPLVTYGLLLFPDGHLPSRHWRWVAWAAGLAIALLAGSYASAPGPLATAPAHANPLVLPLPAAVLRAARRRGLGAVPDLLRLRRRIAGLALAPGARRRASSSAVAPDRGGGVPRRDTNPGTCGSPPVQHHRDGTDRFGHPRSRSGSPSCGITCMAST